MKKLVLPGKLESLSGIRRCAEEAASAAGLDSGRTYDLCLAIDEIATNIIVHGYEETMRSGDIGIRAEVTEGELRLILEDTSPPFDPRTLAPPKEYLDKPLEDRPIGGLGVYLALQSVDGFEYRQKGTTNCSVFTMKLGK